MTCDEFARLFEEPAAPPPAEAEAHLRDCPACAERHEAEALLRRHGRLQLDPPPGLAEAALRAAERGRTPLIHEIRRFAAAAAAAVAVSVVTWLSLDFQPIVGEVTARVDSGVRSVRRLQDGVAQILETQRDPR
jgi:predicted anti-sigma-YlaC factor YlaD